MSTALSVDSQRAEENYNIAALYDSGWPLRNASAARPPGTCRVLHLRSCLPPPAVAAPTAASSRADADFHALDRVVAARRPLCRQGRGAGARIFSEYGLIRHRVRVELAWLVALSDEAAIPEIRAIFRVRARSAIDCRAPPFCAGRRRARQGDRTHDQPRRQGRRILAEGALRRRAGESRASRSSSTFACTSEDINNLAHALALAAARRRRACCRRCATIAADLRGARARACRRRRCCRARMASRRRRPRWARKSPTCMRALERADRRRSSACRSRARSTAPSATTTRIVAAYPDVDWERVAARLVGGTRARSSIRTRRRSSRTTTWRSSSTRSRVPTRS